VSERDRAPADQAEPSAEPGGSENEPGDRFPEGRPGREDQPDDQGRDGQALPLRQPRPASRAPRGFHGSWQLRPGAQDARRPHTLRRHLQDPGLRAVSSHPRSDPPDAGTEYRGRKPDLRLAGAISDGRGRPLRRTMGSGVPGPPWDLRGTICLKW